jgi:hemoglobin-like flavoprotein
MEQKIINHVQQSWAKVATIAPTAAALFYKNFFEADWELEALFKGGDMVAQGERLTNMIGVAVEKLNQLDTLVPVLQSMGARHVGYGVKTAHYATVEGALLKTLEQGLGADFTEEVRAAWVEVLGVMSSVMIAAADAAAAEPVAA